VLYEQRPARGECARSDKAGSALCGASTDESSKAMMQSYLAPKSAGRAVAVIVIAGCSSVQELPKNAVFPSPSGHSTGLTCQAVAEGDFARAPSLLAFDTAKHEWRTDGAAFSEGQPLRGPGVAARDVHPRWTGAQMNTFPSLSQSATAGSPDLVPIGGDYWKRARYPIVPDERRAWVSSAFATRGGGAETFNRGDAPT
jgi:hypothetical protein